jgi:hypothetical protein
MADEVDHLGALKDLYRENLTAQSKRIAAATGVLRAIDWIALIPILLTLFQNCRRDSRPTIPDIRGRNHNVVSGLFNAIFNGIFGGSFKEYSAGGGPSMFKAALDTMEAATPEQLQAFMDEADKLAANEFDMT